MLYEYVANVSLNNHSCFRSAVFNWWYP